MRWANRARSSALLVCVLTRSSSAQASLGLRSTSWRRLSSLRRENTAHRLAHVCWNTLVRFHRRRDETFECNLVLRCNGFKKGCQACLSEEQKELAYWLLLKNLPCCLPVAIQKNFPTRLSTYRSAQ